MWVALLVPRLSLSKMESATPVQILDVAVCFALHANAHVKGMNPSVLPSAMSKIFGQTGSFRLGKAYNLEEGKLLIQTYFAQLKTNIVSYLAHGGEVGFKVIGK